MSQASADPHAAVAHSSAGPGATGLHVARGTLWILAGMLFAQAMGWLNAVVALTFTGVEAWGALVFLNSCLALPVALASQGLPVAALRFVARDAALGEAARGMRTVGAIRWLVLAAGLALALCAPLALAGVPAGVAALVVPGAVIALVAATLIFQPLLQVEQSAALGADDPRLRAIVGSFLQPLLRFAALLAVLWWLPTATGLIVAWVLTLVGAYALARVLLARRGFAFGRPRDVARTDTGALYRYSLPLLGSSLLRLGVYEMDKVFLGFMTDAASVGTYAVASRVAVLVIAPYMAGAQAFAPLVARLWTAGARDVLRDYYQRATVLALVGTGALVGLLFLNLGWILALFGPSLDVAAATTIAQVVALGLLVTVLPGNQAQLYRMSGKTWISAVNMGVITLANVALNLALIPRYGALGAAVASSISIAAANLSGFLFLKLCFGWEIHPVGPRYVSAVLAAGGLALLGGALSHAIGPGIGPTVWLGNAAVLAVAALCLHWLARDALATLLAEARRGR